jgi:hypothetical protein
MSLLEIADAKAKKDKAKRGPKPKGDNSSKLDVIGHPESNENILRRLAREDKTEILDAIDRGESYRTQRYSNTRVLESLPNGNQNLSVNAEKAIATAKMLAKVRAARTNSESKLKNDNARKKINRGVVFDGPSPDEMHLSGEQYQRSPIPAPLFACGKFSISN